MCTRRASWPPWSTTRRSSTTPSSSAGRGDFDSWDLCDQVCQNLFRRTPHAYAKAVEWTAREELFVKRAGFALIAGLAVADKRADDDRFAALLEPLAAGADDDRDLVRKGASWALRSIGKRSAALNELAIATAQELGGRPGRGARWVGTDALRELRSPPVQARLAARDRALGDSGHPRLEREPGHWQTPAMRGLMQDSPLTIDSIFRHVEQHYGDGTIVTNNPGGRHPDDLRGVGRRTRRLGGVLDTLGISADGRVGTFAWNSARHLELYFAAPSTGRVLHTLNVRLFPEQLTYIANHAEDEVIFVDRTVLPLLWKLIDTMTTVRHVVVMDDGGDNEIPDDPRILDYETLLADAEPVDFDVDGRELWPPRCATRAAPPATRRASSTRTARRSCTRWASCSRTPSGSASSDVAMPVVPMFHANAWGIAQAAPAAGASLVMPGRR